MTRCRRTHCVVSTYAAVIFRSAIVMETSGSTLDLFVRDACVCVAHAVYSISCYIFNLPTSIFPWNVWCLVTSRQKCASLRFS